MKLLYVSSSTVPSRSANSVHVMKMCQSIAKIGHEVKLLVKGQSTQLSDVENIFTHYGVTESFEVLPKPFPQFPGRQFIYGKHALDEVKRWKPDLVYGRYFPAMAIIGLAGHPVAYESHERLWDRSRLAMRLGKQLFAAKNFRKLIVISDALKEMYLEQTMIDADRILVSHDASDPSPSLREPDEEPFRVGYIGGVYPGRGIEMLLDCAKALPQVEFHFVGGSEEDLNNLTGQSIPKNVICHGFVSPESVPEIRSGFHALLAPYQRKVAVFGGSGDTSAFMSPLKIFEYMSSNRPILCSDLPVLREVLNEDNALLISPDDTGAWIDAIQSLRNERATGANLAAKALADFEAHYTWDIRAKQILAAVT